ncbi:Na-K-Cl cotransporter [Candidatus Woesearchaeota archaeon]|nr:Na-K-Cl cotransporter [Candidatus Woesearchaeota archaeon]
MTRRKTGSRSFGAFRGVFVPTFLTIIGVILYLRLGRIVGEAGILGAIAIIFLAVSVTVCTGLSLSSITTNIRIGAGGAYSIISKTLGLEVGGSVGIPLYLAQAFSVVLYIFGFTETWKFIFPSHPRLIVLYFMFAVLFLLTFVSLKYAIRTQLLVFGLVLASLVSIFAGGGWWNADLGVSMVAGFTDTGFWPLFALFFPAVTGLMAGVGMSGELTNPKKQIPKGILTALGITTVIYLAMVMWLGFSSNANALAADNMIMVKLAAYSPLVLAGILAATFSSALTTLVAAPRLLQALAENSTLFFNKTFAKKTKKGEPRNATILTAGIIVISLALGRLDTIAPVLTMFFLITYAMINVVVLLEQSIGFVSFRPTFRIPKIIPLYGSLMSLLIMIYINIIAGIVAIGFLFIIYVLLARRNLKAKKGHVRSGLLTALAEWAARHVQKLSESRKHIWKPNILLAAVTSDQLADNFPLIKAIIYPHGTLSVLGMDLKHHDKRFCPESDTSAEQEQKNISELVQEFGSKEIFTSYAPVRSMDYIEGVRVSLQAMKSQFFHPNILFLPYSISSFKKQDMKMLFDTARTAGSGLVIYDEYKKRAAEPEEDISVWLPNKAYKGDFYSDRTFDLAMLVAYSIQRNWIGKITLRICVDKKNKEGAERYLKKLVYEARFPHSTQTQALTQTKARSLRSSGKELHIISVADEKELMKTARYAKKIKRTFMYVFDSTEEDVLA